LSNSICRYAGRWQSWVSINLNAEIPDGAFNLGVAEQELHGMQVRVQY
jgi:hypothetical protein